MGCVSATIIDGDCVWIGIELNCMRLCDCVTQNKYQCGSHDEPTSENKDTRVHPRQMMTMMMMIIIDHVQMLTMMIINNVQTTPILVSHAEHVVAHVMCCDVSFMFVVCLLT